MVKRPNTPRHIIDDTGDTLTIYTHAGDYYLSMSHGNGQAVAGPFTPDQLQHLVAEATGPARTRDQAGVVTATILLCVALLLGLWAVTSTSWAMLLLLIPAAILLVLGLTGAALSWPREVRDDSGKRVQS